MKPFISNTPYKIYFLVNNTIFQLYHPPDRNPMTKYIGFMLMFSGSWGSKSCIKKLA